MGDVRGFLKVKRLKPKYRPVCERVKDYSDVAVLPAPQDSQEQASRCMDCAVAFCHWGCPIGNVIPEWNDLVFHGHWEKAFRLLASTNNLPEITGRLCPALCESACVLGINDDAVTIRENELAIIEYAFNNGLVKPRKLIKRTTKKIAVIGSGPSGLACADQLNQMGHMVNVFEKDKAVGGILRYGIPDFKLEKNIIDRRINILEQEGIRFITGTEAGKDYSLDKLKNDFDAICLCMGSRVPRDLKIEGRDLKGIHFAMDYLIQSNIRASGGVISEKEAIDARGKKVVVIGGGDTGSDCVGTACRQGASCVTQIEVMPKPSESRTCDFPWPVHPLLLKTTTSHEETGERKWAVLTKRFNGSNGFVKSISCVEACFEKDSKGCMLIKEKQGTEFVLEADLVILAIGFLHTQHKGLVSDLSLELDLKGNIKTDDRFMTSVKGVFSCGDMRRGQSLIVWAIAEGRNAAESIGRYLKA
ncbi:MAG: glutamate synthase subunit beta [Candidatus Omnitrophica bacterium]|jgi:glutamate synthase (NADPH/NADH) small chain|nr:glutamate synthase subunit beta [Candidatus Omnitrophota bacterium]